MSATIAAIYAGASAMMVGISGTVAGLHQLELTTCAKLKLFYTISTAG
jgi:hypothetical protein